MAEVLDLVLDGVVDPSDADAAWVAGVLADSHPDVLPKITHEGWPKSGETFVSTYWPPFSDALSEAGVTDGALRSWEAVAALVEALDYPLEKLAETVQHVRSAVVTFRGLADSLPDPGRAASARRIADALAYAFATQGDDDETLRDAFREWHARLGPERTDPVPAP